MRILLLIPVLAIAILIIVFKDKLGTKPLTQSTPAQEQQSQEPPMTFEQVLALGGTCFNNGFADDTNDVEAAPDGQSRTKAPNRSEYDVKRIALGVQGNSIVSVWEIAGSLNEENLQHLNINFQTIYNRNNTVKVSREARDGKWAGNYSPEKGELKDFDPQGRFQNNLFQFSIPRDFISTNGIVDMLTFNAYFYEKPITTMFNDNVSVRFQPFSC